MIAARCEECDVIFDQGQLEEMCLHMEATGHKVLVVDAGNIIFRPDVSDEELQQSA